MTARAEGVPASAIATWLEPLAGPALAATPWARLFGGPEAWTAWREHFGQRVLAIGWRDEEGAPLAIWPFTARPFGFGEMAVPFGAEWADQFAPQARRSLTREELAAGLRLLGRRVALVWLPLVDEPLATLLAGVQALAPAPVLRPRTRDRGANHRTPLPPVDADFAAWRHALLGADGDKDLRRYTRRLEEQGTVAWQRVDDPAAIRAVLPEIASLEAVSGREALGTRHFRVPAQQRFYRDWLPALAARQLAVLHLLTIEGAVAAYAIGLTPPGVFGLHAAGYDPRYARWSPGRTLIAWSLERAWRDGARLYDFLQGDFAWKARLARSATRLTEFWLSPPGLRGQGTRLLVGGMLALRRRTSPEVEG